MLLELGQHDLRDLLIDTLRLFSEQRHDDVSQLLENDSLAQRVLDCLLDGRLDLLLLLLLSRQQLLQLVRLLRQLLILARQIVEAL